MAKTTTLESRTKEAIAAINDYVARPHVHKLTRFDLISYAAGYSKGRGINLEALSDAIMKLYVDGAIEA